jgi:hypothetical protein
MGDREKIIIMDITRTHVTNELDGTFNFDLSNVFDDDAETQAMRRKIDAAVAMDNREVNLSVRRAPAPPPPREEHSNLDPVQTDTEADAIDMLMESTADSAPFQGDSAEEVARKVDTMTVRGQRIHRNRQEVTNTISLGVIPPSTTVCVDKVLYKVSLSLLSASLSHKSDRPASRLTLSSGSLDRTRMSLKTQPRFTCGSTKTTRQEPRAPCFHT